MDASARRGNPLRAVKLAMALRPAMVPRWPTGGRTHRRALDSFERVLGMQHPHTLTSVNNLAGCMRALGDASGALPLYRRALDSSERALGKG